MTREMMGSARRAGQGVTIENACRRPVNLDSRTCLERRSGGDPVK